jgi:hypothetical protein
MLRKPDDGSTSRLHKDSTQESKDQYAARLPGAAALRSMRRDLAGQAEGVEITEGLLALPEWLQPIEIRLAARDACNGR